MTMDADALRRALAAAGGSDLLVGRRIEWHARIDSTNLRARDLAASGEPEGTVVLAGEQSQGRGRGSRVWHSAPGTGVYLSAILRPEAPPASVPVFGLMAALATAEALRALGGDSVVVKWPNDLIVGAGHPRLARRKLAGILTEARTSSEGIRDLVIGIGINIGQAADDFPDELRAIATSLREVTGQSPGLVAGASAAILALDRWYRLWQKEGDAPILDAYPANAPGLTGRRVRVDDASGGWTGVTAGLSADGALRIRRDDAPDPPGDLVMIRHGEMVRIEET